MNVNPSTVPTAIFKKAGLRETSVLLALAWLLPFAIHLVPWAGERPLGAYLLPMFWATFVAVYFYGAAIGVLVGLCAPVLNLLITGLPAWKFLSVMSIELVVFALVATWLVRRAPRLILSAPLGYIVAKLASTGLLVAVPVFGELGAPGEFLVLSLSGAAAGLVILAMINLALVRWYPKQG